MTDRLKVLNDTPPTWYAEGLRFECTQCGACCTGSPGYTWLADDEIQAIAIHLNLTPSEFSKRYLRYVNGRYALLENAVNFDCIFLKDKKCQIYTVRPSQCRTFPWWTKNLASLEDWERAASFCEGISKSAPLVSMQTIENQLAQNKQ